MRVVACVEADLSANPLGLPSRALDDLGGKPVIRRTVEALLRAGVFDACAVVCRPGERSRLAPALAGLAATVRESGAADVPLRAELRRARKWSLTGWRGGLLWATAFDELGWPAALLEAAREEAADSVAIVRAEAPLLDAALTAEMTRHHLKQRDRYYLTFAQAPVGLLPEICTAGFLQTMAASGQTPREVLRYRSERPEMDKARAECHFDAGDAIRRAPVRLAADTRRGIEGLRALWKAAGDPERLGARGWVDLAASHPEAFLGEAPPFVSVELVRDPAFLPISEGAPTRFLAPDALDRLLAGLSGWDDLRVSLEGFGDPLAHPAFDEVLAVLARRRPFGISLATAGPLLDEARCESLADHRVDIVEAPILPRTSGSDAARAGLQRLLDLRKRRADAPIAVASAVKTLETEPELEAFYDAWLAAGAWPVIRSPNAFAGQAPDRSLLPTSLARRLPCAKLARELYVDAAGQALVCRQDLAAKVPLGDVRTASLPALWTEGALARLRAAHAKEDWSAFPLCPACQEWDRL